MLAFLSSSIFYSLLSVAKKLSGLIGSNQSLKVSFCLNYLVTSLAFLCRDLTRLRQSSRDLGTEIRKLFILHQVLVFQQVPQFLRDCSLALKLRWLSKHSRWLTQQTIWKWQQARSFWKIVLVLLSYVRLLRSRFKRVFDWYVQGSCLH